jgi:cell division septation protein DedD
VDLAERLKAAGYEAHIAAEAARTGQITLRHGNFISRQDAEAASRKISGLGVANEAGRVR